MAAFLRPGAAPSPALLQAVLQRDLPAVEALLAAPEGSSLIKNGLGALHAAALADWGAVVPLLVAAGASVHQPAEIYGSTQLAHLGLTAEQLEAVCPANFAWQGPRTPLCVAVQLGAFDAAAALLGAGAELAPPFILDSGRSSRAPQGAWEALPQLAAARSAAAGTPTTASESAPQLVQRMAALLLEAHPLLRLSIASCHAAAAALAFPHGSVQPCPWLLERLLQLHHSGQLAAMYGVGMAVEAVLRRLLQGSPVGDAGQAARVEASAVAWLRLPAVQRLDSASLVRLAAQCYYRGLTDAALPALLQLEGVREARRQGAQPPENWTRQCGSTDSLVAAAAATGQPDVLDAVLAAGGAVTLQAVNEIVKASIDLRYDAAKEARSLPTLRLLLSRGAPPVPAEVLDSGAAIWACPIYALLESYVFEECSVCDLYLNGEIEGPPFSNDTPLQQLHLQALRTMDALAEASYRPATFTVRYYHRGGTSCYPPDAHGSKWELDSDGKWLWLAAQRMPWSPASHASFPPAFRATARALLLEAHRQTVEAAGGAASLGALPQPLLHAILGRAAYPLSAWRPRRDTASILEGLEESVEEARAEEEAERQAEEEEYWRRHGE